VKSDEKNWKLKRIENLKNFTQVCFTLSDIGKKAKNNIFPRCFEYLLNNRDFELKLGECIYYSRTHISSYKKIIEHKVHFIDFVTYIWIAYLISIWANIQDLSLKHQVLSNA